MQRGHYIKFTHQNGIYLPEQNEGDFHRLLRQELQEVVSFHYTRHGDYIYEILLLTNRIVNFTIWDLYNIIDDAIFQDH